jgi:hypothetical protein
MAYVQDATGMIDYRVVNDAADPHPAASQPLGHALPAQRRVRVRLTSVLLDQRVGIELQRASFRWRVTVLALSIARRVPNSTIATFPEAPL